MFLSCSVKFVLFGINDPLMKAFHGPNHEGDIKNSTKPKMQLPPPPKQMRKITIDRFVFGQNVKPPSIVCMTK